jgi:WhiB family redox-sensing transcriptional regulator
VTADRGKQAVPKRRTHDLTDTSWHKDAACLDADDALFYHPANERGMDRVKRAEAAKAVCRGCPVLDTCREDAIARREPFGTWGAMSEDERKTFLRRRQRSRRKVAA